MFWWPTCDINCHRIVGDYIHLLFFPALLSFPNSSGLQYTWPLFFLGAISDSTHSGLVTVCVLCFFFFVFRGFPWASCVSQDHGKVRVRLQKFRLSGKDGSIWTKAIRSNLSKCCKKVISTFHGNFSWNNEWISVSCYHSWMAGRWFNKLSWDRKTSFSFFSYKSFIVIRCFEGLLFMKKYLNTQTSGL